ncbi:periplasmic heavy metal sensor [Paragemmobacter ruber]|uniref:Periplasmic heavy metal sensor n=1 Tax=Paragemmobacter ruber TaxID=1985673 RepID=A0ABW9Y1M8_9RHOB|nr:periplasmic heavy metal sensor [Rhodobacter ruber]NBE06399.1 periplasmic heavy metal sensor [Rhodobacter ruber]
MTQTTSTPAAPPPASPPARSGKGLRIALALSVALNLLVVGVVAGALLRDGDPRGRVVRDLDFGPFTEALSPRDREALRREFVARAPEMREIRQEIRADLETLLGVLRREPFDAATLQAVMDSQQGRMARRIEIGRELLIERLAMMSPEERAAFADRLEQRLRRGGGQGRPANGADAP